MYKSSKIDSDYVIEPLSKSIIKSIIEPLSNSIIKSNFLVLKFIVHSFVQDYGIYCIIALKLKWLLNGNMKKIQRL